MNMCISYMSNYVNYMCIMEYHGLTWIIVDIR